AGAGNVIANSNGIGVAVNAQTVNINNVITTVSTGSATVRGNSIVANGGLGIDINPAGINANDAGDLDTGPSNGQNFPLLTAAAFGASTIVNGTLNSGLNSTYVIDFYANGTLATSCDASGNGEGQRYIGSINVQTVGNDVSFHATGLGATALNERITATA